MYFIHTMDKDGNRTRMYAGRSEAHARDTMQVECGNLWLAGAAVELLSQRDDGNPVYVVNDGAEDAKVIWIEDESED